MNSREDSRFTTEERASIRAAVNTLRAGGFAGGEASSFGDDGAELVSVMLINDGSALYVIGKQTGGYYMLDRDGKNDARSERLENVLAALP